jgi:hypothetical protein
MKNSLIIFTSKGRNGATAKSIERRHWTPRGAREREEERGANRGQRRAEIKRGGKTILFNFHSDRYIRKMASRHQSNENGRQQTAAPKKRRIVAEEEEEDDDEDDDDGENGQLHRENGHAAAKGKRQKIVEEEPEDDGAGDEDGEEEEEGGTQGNGFSLSQLSQYPTAAANGTSKYVGSLSLVTPLRLVAVRACVPARRLMAEANAQQRRTAGAVRMQRDTSEEPSCAYA